ncbi:MAG: hypothetical protein ABSF77_10560 [Spirochaetia bacterium]|jgi:hypothetical protein
MKKPLAALAAILLLALAVPAAFAEVELGLSWTPIQDPNVTTTNAMQNVPGFHVGYGWFILYAAWDSLAMPSFWVERAAGPSVPAFLNLYDAGIRLIFKPLEIYATVGTNNLRVYEDSHDYGFGANIRLGAGLKFHWWGITLSGTNVYGSWADLTAVATGLASASTREWAFDQIVNGLVPSLNLTFYF